MKGPLEAAKDIAARNRGDSDEPEKPCEYAEFELNRPCKNHMWSCTNPDSEHEEMPVRGDYCMESCDARMKPVTIYAWDRDHTVDVSKGPVPLGHVKTLASNHKVYAIGNQALKREAKIPGREEIQEQARRQLSDEKIEQVENQWDSSGRAGMKGRVLALLKCLYPNKERIVVDDNEDLRDMSGWQYFTPQEYMEDVSGHISRKEDWPSLSMIFTVYDEDAGEVKASLESAAESYPHEALELVVVDDGANSVKSAVDEAEIGDAEAVYLRNEENNGVGRSRNQGAEAASGDVLSFHDAHMRFPLYDELIEAADNRGHELQLPQGWSSTMMLVHKAQQKQCLISSASCDVRKEKNFYASGADLFWNRRDGLQPKWRMPIDWRTQWKRVPCIMGAGYFMSRETVDELTCTGQLWEDTAGKWGVSEQALSVKAFLLDIPVFASRDIFTRHLYRGKNPVSGAGNEIWKNVCRCFSRLFSTPVFERRFLPYVQKRLNDEEAEEARTEPMEVPRSTVTTPAPYWPVDERKVFTHLVGEKSSVTERHPDHEWLDEVSDAAESLDEDDPNILMWRPGEALFTIKRVYPDADITCIVAPGPRANNWWDLCQARGIKIVKTRLTHDYVSRPVDKNWGPFDLVLVNGELQNECCEVANELLAEGGQIVCNERADRRQLEQNQQKEEKANMKEALGKRDSKPDAQPERDEESARDERPTQNEGETDMDLTVLLLNWRRPENMDKILNALENQTAEPQIFLWDNSGEYESDERIDWIVQSERNLGGMARWWMGAAAETEYICTLDDDLMPSDDSVLADMLAVAKRHNSILGPYGWCADEEFKPGSSPAYKGGQHVHYSEEDRKVDAIKGRCMMMRRDLLARVPLSPEIPMDEVEREELLKRCDDLYVSVWTARAQPKQHLVPGVSHHRFSNVGSQDSRSLAGDTGHYRIRERALEAFLKQWEDKDA